jgi:GT2 family glycosyltransferase
VLFFLDDDAMPVGTEFLSRAVAVFDDDARIGVLPPRWVDPTGGATAPRHVPRVGGRGPLRAGDVAWFWEGGSLLRRDAFDLAGGWPGEFFYGHEGIELAWRVIDAGYRVRYQPDLEVLNPPAAAFRGEQHGYLDARNRIWVARRNLPVVFGALYCVVWIAATLLRARDGAGRRAAIRGFRDGVRLPAGPRRPIGWRTCWTLTRLGRPPIV